MYCSTCGALVPPGRVVCATCGARVAGAGPGAPARPGPMSSTGYPPARPALGSLASVCPRCGYRGEGISYFSRGKHVIGLVVAAMFTSWAMGAGAVIYYVLRKDHRVCPRCGEGWGQRGELAASAAGLPAEPSHPQPVAAGSFADSSRGGFSILLFLLAAILATAGIVNGRPGPLLLAAIAAGAGLLLHRHAENQREARRAALISSLQLPVLKLAADHGGRLTVTEVATRLGWTLPRAEKVLESLEDGYRVSSEVTDEGLIVYEFRELMHAQPELPTRLASQATRPLDEPR